MIAVVMSQAVLGRPITASEAWVRIKPQAWKLLGLALLVTLIIVGITVVAVVLVVILGVLTLGIGLLLLLGTWVPGAVLITYWAIAPAALLLERSRVTASMSRAWSLTKGALLANLRNVGADGHHLHGDQLRDLHSLLRSRDHRALRRPGHW